MSNATVVYIALGSNFGDRLASLRSAVELLEQRPEIVVDRTTGVASLYETVPVGGPTGQSTFLNSAIRMRTMLGPMPLMECLLEIEQGMGRTRKVKWESRVIDLDLLLYDQCVCESPSLTLPHPRLHERRFVLEPLAEIAGEVTHPIFGVTIAKLNAALRAASDQRVVRIAGPEWANPQQ